MVHALGIVGRNFRAHPRDVESGLITPGAHLEHRQAGLEGALAKILQARAELGVACQHDARECDSIERGERRAEDDIVPVGRHDEKRAGREDVTDVRDGARAEREGKHAARGHVARPDHLGIEVPCHVAGAERLQRGVGGNGSEEFEEAAFEKRASVHQPVHGGRRFSIGGDFRGLVTGRRIADGNESGFGILARPADFVDDAADEFRVVDAAVERGQRFHLPPELFRAFLAEGGDQDDLGVEVAGHQAVEAVVERAALGRQQPLDDDDIRILAGFADFPDDALHQVVDALLAHIIIRLLDRDRFRRHPAHRRLDEKGGGIGIAGGAVILGDRLAEADADAAAVERADDAQADRGEADAGVRMLRGRRCVSWS